MELLIKLGLFALIFLVAFSVLYRRLRNEQDPEWEGRWRSLPQSEQERLAEAARRGERLEDPDEAYLAAGSAREQRSLGSGAASFVSGRAVLVGVVLIASIAAGSPLMIAVSLLLLSVFGVLAYRARAVDRNLERAEEVNRSL
ncbi:MAG TPA: hypothetical protein VFJ61_09245 [Solirubrobacterales bacterium]|nr:hypothetical protein [Solirubrobacterales bacterium]